MKITVETCGKAAILRLDGKLTTGGGDVNMRQKIKELLDSGNKAILLDLSKVKNIDSGGIGEVVSSYTTAKNKGAVMKLLNIPERVMAIFQMTQLITVFETFDSEKEALDSF